MEIEAFQLRNMLIAAAELGATRALIKVGKIKPFMSKSEAYKLYGRGTVDRWIAEGNLKPCKDGNNTSTVRIDRMRLEELSMASNQTTYLGLIKSGDK